MRLDPATAALRRRDAFEVCECGWNSTTCARADALPSVAWTTAVFTKRSPMIPVGTALHDLIYHGMALINSLVELCVERRFRLAGGRVVFPPCGTICTRSHFTVARLRRRAVQRLGKLTISDAGTNRGLSQLKPGDPSIGIRFFWKKRALAGFIQAASSAPFHRRPRQLPTCKLMQAA